MRDIHSHILYDVDDGVTSIDDSISILRNASSNGVRDVILTPHYVSGTTYNVNNGDKLGKFNILKGLVEEYNIDINLYLGNEVFLDSDICSLIDSDIYTLNGSRYILVEFSLNSYSDNISDIIDELIDREYIPVIAHPERYFYLNNNIMFFRNLIKKGCLLQGNSGSIYGKYGNKCKRMLIRLLKYRMISFISSDIHKVSDDIYNRDIYNDLYDIVRDRDYVKEILDDNAYKVINDLDIDISLNKYNGVIDFFRGFVIRG